MIYFSKELLGSQHVYKPEQIIYESNIVGSENIKIKESGIYEIVIAGGSGGSGKGWWYNGITYYANTAIGGNGRGYIANIKLTRNSTLSLTVGGAGANREWTGGAIQGVYTITGDNGGTSDLSVNNVNMIKCNGGGGGISDGYAVTTGGTGGIIINSSLNVVTEILNQGGLPSQYGSYGNFHNGGYIRLKYISSRG